VQHRQLLISQKRELVADLKGVKGERDLLMQQLKEWQTFAEEAGGTSVFICTRARVCLCVLKREGVCEKE
jgi:hypothetical protein